MSDQDETPRHRKLTDSEVRRKVYGVPVTPPREDGQSFDDGDELTQPHDLIERSLSDSTRTRSKRDTEEPATVGMLLSLADAFLQERSGSRQREADMETVLKAPHEVAAELRAEISDIKKTLRSARRLVYALVSACGLYAGSVASGFLHRAETAAADTVRLQGCQDAIIRIDADLRAMRALLGRGSSTGWLESPVASLSSKGSP